MYGGTVLSGAVWSATHEPMPNQLQAIQELLAAGARADAVQYPTGHDGIDELLSRHRSLS